MKLFDWIYLNGGIEAGNNPQRELCDAAFKCIKNIIRESGIIRIIKAIIDPNLIIHDAGLELFKGTEEIRKKSFKFC